MYYYIYKITNLVNNKIYIGVHKTKDLDDGYMGSGKVIKQAIKKYGVDNFRKDILEFFDTYELALFTERNMVTDELLLREDVYNLRRGGSGGFDYINKNGLNPFENKEIQLKGNSPEARRKAVKTVKVTYKKIQHQQGSSNSQYGAKVCINLETGEKKRFKEVPDGWIWVKEYKEQQMKNSKRWYNDGSKNYYITLPNVIIEELGLVKGRIR